MVFRVWKLLRNYISINELLCIFFISLSVFLVIFWLIYISMLPDVAVPQRLDFYSTHCGIISERLAREIDDLARMKEKLSYEVALLEGKRNNDLAVYKQIQHELISLQNEKKQMQSEMDLLTTSYRRLQNELYYSTKEASFDQNVVSQKSVLERSSFENMSENDRQLEAKNPENSKLLPSFTCCQTCLFSFYLMKPAQLSNKETSIFYELLAKSKYRIEDPTNTCFVVSVGDVQQLDVSATELKSKSSTNRIHYDSSFRKIDAKEPKFSHLFAIVAVDIENACRKRDIILPFNSLELNLSSTAWIKRLAPFVPLRRPILISFDTTLGQNSSSYYWHLYKILSLTNWGSKMVLRYGSSKNPMSEPFTDGDLPGSLDSRLSMLGNSTFAIVTGPNIPSVQTRLIEALSQATIPVVVTSELHSLPFNDFIDWRLSCVVFTRSQLGILPSILKSMSDNDLMALKRRGRDLFMQYFANRDRIVETSLEVLRSRVGLRANPVPNYATPYKKTISHLGLSSNADYLLNLRESPEYLSNYSFLIKQHHIWNTFPGPFWAYPHDPDKAVLPSEAKFRGSERGFRPINFGKGGDGKFFRLALGGDIESESFTILILTYKREQLLMQMIKDFDKLPNLHSVVVVWNAPGNVSHTLVWPIISAPIHVVKGPKNSLNNRFLPYEEIKTEAVLSLDDDVFLTHEEILLTFRVWRENRERIVGLPGRLHSWDPESQSWFYNNYLSCELSLVLTGAAFLHKYYFYLYTYSMPALIRARVDQFMNCEDIAINFLVSHITRKPPIKATAKRTFYCAQCGEDSLWIDSSHLTERSECINFFSQVYGYNPLMSTQYRADSILYRSVFADPDMVACFDKV